MIAIIDYGAGNLFSVKNARDYIGEASIITSRIDEIRRADSCILPGVGAFPYAMKMLHETGLTNEIKKQAKIKPLLGICLGMQMLFEESCEFGITKGLGLIPGSIRNIYDCGLKIPHMGWNSLKLHQPDNAFLKGISEQDCVYFVHSYMAITNESYVAASCEYGGSVTALAINENVYGAQFHPEKSGEAGLLMLKNFGGLTK